MRNDIKPRQSRALLTVYEHDTFAYAWTEQDLASLERLNRTSGVNILRPTMIGAQRALAAAQYVGIVRLGNQSIQILPKLHRSGRSAADQSTRNLLHLLAYTADFPVHEHGMAQMHDRPDDWFEILTWLFAQHLLKLWRHGPCRFYRLQEEVLPVLKGQWHIDRQIQRPSEQHRFYVSHDEFTEDTPLNRVLRFVVERLWRLTRSRRSKQGLDLLRIWMADVSLPSSVTAQDAERIRLSRLNQHYAPVLNLAKLFLGHSAIQLAAGRVESFSFTFDMNQLFESFVIGFLRRHRNQILRAPLWAATLHPQSLGITAYLATTDTGKAHFRLKPDLVFRIDDAHPLIIDTKYKPLQQSARQLSIAPSDVYQMAAYAARYRCPRIILLYPQTAEINAPILRRFHIDNTDATVEVHTLDVRQDLVSVQSRNLMIRQFDRILNDYHPHEDQSDVRD